MKRLIVATLSGLMFSTVWADSTLTVTPLTLPVGNDNAYLNVINDMPSNGVYIALTQAKDGAGQPALVSALYHSSDDKQWTTDMAYGNNTTGVITGMVNQGGSLYFSSINLSSLDHPGSISVLQGATGALQIYHAPQAVWNLWLPPTVTSSTLVSTSIAAPVTLVSTGPQGYMSAQISGNAPLSYGNPQQWCAYGKPFPAMTMIWPILDNQSTGAVAVVDCPQGPNQFPISLVSIDTTGNVNALTPHINQPYPNAGFDFGLLFGINQDNTNYLAASNEADGNTTDVIAILPNGSGSSGLFASTTTYIGKLWNPVPIPATANNGTMPALMDSLHYGAVQAGINVVMPMSIIALPQPQTYALVFCSHNSYLADCYVQEAQITFSLTNGWVYTPLSGQAPLLQSKSLVWAQSMKLSVAQEASGTALYVGVNTGIPQYGEYHPLLYKVTGF